MLTEKTYTLAAASTIDERLAQYNTFFTDVLSAEGISLIQDGNYFWLDGNKSCGFYPYIASSTGGIYAVYDYKGTIEKYISKNFRYDYGEILYYHVSQNKNSVYLRSHGNTSTSSTGENYCISAKDEKDAWHIFSGSYIFGAEGQINAQSGVAADTKAPFIASKSIAPDGAKFLELNRLLFATSFEISSTLVAFDGVPHRVVSVDGAAPCFTFPVSEN